jgi:hypothetical protein
LRAGFNVLRGHLIAVDSSYVGGSIGLPQTTMQGAGFGEDITNADLTFAIKREPVAHRMTFHVAHDIFDKWFIVEDTKPKDKDEEFDVKIQAELSKLKAKDVFTQMASFERGYGYALIVVGYQDSAKKLADPVEKPQKILQLAAYAPTNIGRIIHDKDSSSLRFGLPEYYYVKRSSTNRERVHHSRVIHFATRLLDHTYKGLSVLEPVWDDLTSLRNIRWGMGQTMFRLGSGFPDIEIKGANKEKIDAFNASGQFHNLQARTYFVHNENQKLEFKGAQGVALDPERYYLPIMENISTGSGIPLAVLRGVQAGALTGSEVNEREYYTLISDAQGRYEPGLRHLIDQLIEIGQVSTTVEAYAVDWFGGFEVNEKDKALTALTLAQANRVRTNYMTLNEIRVEEGELHDFE